ncbi:NAD(P)/FAD-dependent oxidoreductase [Sedimentitalea nanhaiensis]|uniref:Sarcosine oxidase subunit beta n=1 Tax=Sedimentitalea nanhaiensis TaxID=999627 RepID=A0A1I7D952_9RHOB|nr:FAD-binding oxidoreductase [Sedimentitalea nanhaiensis]SFU08114.1 sarcosine oxidase subunit beta [Sedimentitalea nanhaiensis]
MSAPDVLIVGAGITGATAALALAEAGVSVEVIDRYGPAAMASGWTLAGVRQSGRDPAELPLARAAVALWRDLDNRLEAKTGYRQTGNLRLARNNAEIATIHTLVAEQTAAGLPLELLSDITDIRAIAPGLSETIKAASWCASDGQADPVATVNAYLGMAAKLGAQISMGEAALELTVDCGRVSRVVTHSRSISPGAVILATGTEVNVLLDPLGQTLPLRRPVVTVLRSAPCNPVLAPVLGVANADMAARQEESGHFRVTSGAEDGSGKLCETDGKPVIRPVAQRVMEAIATVSAVLPVFAEVEIDSIWAGALDLTPDALPVIDCVPGVHNLVVAAGFSGHGFGIGPVTGALAADLALNRTPHLSLDAFGFERFTKPGLQAPLTLHG